jgi:aminopeptidase N/puromycin-sensitive aminopeptidase
LLTAADHSLKIPAQSIFANAGGKGYYRSAYPSAVYAALVAQAETTLSPGERISLIGDEWAQVRANKAPIGAYLDLATALKADTGAEVIGTALSRVSAAYSRLAANAEERAALSAWIRSTFAPEYAKLGAPTASDSPNTRELRAQLFGALGYFGKDPAVLADARGIAAKYLADPSFVDASFGQAALAITARNGDAALFDQLQKIYETSANPEVQENALRLLAQFEDPALLKRALDYAVSGKVRNQDAIIQFSIALGIDESREQAWKYVQDNWEKVQAQLTTEMGGVLVSSTSSFCAAESRASVQSFFSAHKVPSSDVALKHALENIDSCIEFRKLQEPNLKLWMATRPKQ